MGNALKRSVFHLFRGKWKTVLLMLTMVTVSVLVLTALVIVHAVKTTEKSLHDRLMTTFMLQQDAYNSELFVNNVFYEGPKLTEEIYDTICSMDEIVDSNRETSSGTARLEFSGRMDLLPNSWYMAAKTEDWTYVSEMSFGIINNLLTAEQINCYGNENSRLNSLFTSGKYELVEGRHIQPDDNHVLLISKDVADLNGLRVGDTVYIGRSQLSVDQMNEILDPADEKTWREDIAWMRDDPDAWDAREFVFAEPFRIVGLYTVEVESTLDFIPSVVPENLVFMDYSTMEYMKEKSAEADGTTISDFQRQYYFDEFSFEVSDPSVFDETIDRIKEEIPETELFRWTTNADSDRVATAPIQWIGKIAYSFAVAIACAGVILCTLIALFWNKSRKREVGILLSTGEKKRSIIFQILTEGVVVALIAVLLSLPIVALVINKMDTASMLKTAAAETYQEQLFEDNAETPLTGGVRKLDVTNRNFTPEKLDLSLDFGTVSMTLVIMLLTVCIALLLANIGLVFKSPKKILEQN